MAIRDAIERSNCKNIWQPNAWLDEQAKRDMFASIARKSKVSQITGTIGSWTRVR